LPNATKINFFFPQKAQTGSGSQLASYLMTKVSSPVSGKGNKAWSWPLICMQCRC